MKNKKKINLGIIGKNFGYKVIYKSFAKNKNYKIFGFASKSKKKNKLKISKNIKSYTNWKKLILDKNIDAVAIATPPEMHKKIIKFAIKHNKHIFCEKPFTCSEKEARHICKMIEKKRKISHMVNYEFPEIDAFRFFKRKILNKKIKIKKINLNWILNMKKRTNGWKDYHNKGGGIMFNYVCHTIFYMEFLFGKIISIKSNIYKNKKNISFLNSIIYFKSGLSAKLNIKVFSKNFTNKPIHQLKLLTDKNVYLLTSKVNKLSDQFQIIKINRILNKKIFLLKKNKNIIDFRIKPTFLNSKKFSDWILKGKSQKPNFFDTQRIHFIINQMIESFKEEKIIF